ncbi:Zinc finger and BTB domain-containing protein 7C [Orchesella cincta]|uniref:Zinc finger and BTB domain-containing protein 7C n=1 Tax=Orchesella cincta TaxID=48709 RepID=A0A1D2NGY4_ORCCI|nr:Zinc finger and BTB domain-containing protein 7C [Orchesella cincta]
MEGGSNFQIDTKGACFLCLKVPSTHNGLGCGSFKNYSFRQLSRYLSLDFLKIFNISISLHAFSNSALENSEVTITICVDCCDTTNKFSLFYQELERIQGELNQCVRQVHDIMVSADRNSDTVQQYRQRMIRTNPAQLIEASIAEKLREETIRKCFHKAMGSNTAVKGEKHDKRKPDVKQVRQIPSQPSSSTNGVTFIALQNQGGELQRNSSDKSSSGSNKPTQLQMKKDPDEEVINLSSDDESDSVAREPAIQINSIVDRNGQVYSASGEYLTPRPSLTFNNYSSNPLLNSTAADATINEFIFPSLPSGSSISVSRPTASSSLFPFPKPRMEYKCDICEKVTHSRHYLEQHKRQHTGQKPYHCIHCNGKFVSQATLKIHIVRDHRELLFSQFKDPNTSPQDFKAAVDQLFENYRRSDDRTRPYLCAHCDIQGYLHKRDLQAHMFQYHFDLLASKLQNFQRASNYQMTPHHQQFGEMTSSLMGPELAENGTLKRMRPLDFW